MKAHKGLSDTSDEVVDTVRRSMFMALSIEKMWPDEIERKRVVSDLAAFKESDADTQLRERWRRFLDDVLAYEGELKDLDHGELLSQATAVRTAAIKAAPPNSGGAEFDVWAPYNRPEAAADFDMWLSMPVWEPEEAVALSFGKDPELVNLGTLVVPRRNGTPFIRSFKARFQQVMRAIKAGELDAHIRPDLFVEWARKRGLQLDDGLALVPDKSSADHWKARCEAAEAQVDDLTSRLSAIEAELEAVKRDQDFKPNPKRKTSWNKLVLGMAIARFGHLPSGLSAATLLVVELAEVGLGVKYDAINEILTEAANEISDEYKIPKKRQVSPLRFAD